MVDSAPHLERKPIWSTALTGPLAARIPPRWHPAALLVIKTVHTVAFFSIAGSILLFTWDGFQQRRSRRTSLAVALALTETMIYTSNNQVCPLSPLAVELGARRGSVTDIFLPRRLSERIPVLSGTTLIVGMIVHLSAWIARR